MLTQKKQKQYQQDLKNQQLNAFELSILKELSMNSKLTKGRMISVIDTLYALPESKRKDFKFVLNFMVIYRMDAIKNFLRNALKSSDSRLAHSGWRLLGILLNYCPKDAKSLFKEMAYLLNHPQTLNSVKTDVQTILTNPIGPYTDFSKNAFSYALKNNAIFLEHALNSFESEDVKDEIFKENIKANIENDSLCEEGIKAFTQPKKRSFFEFIKSFFTKPKEPNPLIDYLKDLKPEAAQPAAVKKPIHKEKVSPLAFLKGIKIHSLFSKESQNN